MSLLIIEDDEPFVELMLRAIKPDAYRVARSIREAFQLLEQHAPDVILLDLSLPGSPVDDTIKHIRDLKTRSKDATIIVITGYPDFPRLKEAAVREGAQSVLSKDSGGIFGTLSDEVLKSLNARRPSDNPLVAKVEDTVKKIVGGDGV